MHGIERQYNYINVLGDWSGICISITSLCPGKIAGVYCFINARFHVNETFPGPRRITSLRGLCLRKRGLDKKLKRKSTIQNKVLATIHACKNAKYMSKIENWFDFQKSNFTDDFRF